MRKLFMILILGVFAGTGMYAQNCSRYYPLVEGAKMEYTNYNAKGKETGTMFYSINEVSNNGAVTTATMQMKLTDDKGKDVLSSEYNVTCEGDLVKIDFKSLMNDQMMQQFEDMEVDISGTDLELPNNLSVGQELADANMEMKVNMGAMNMNMNVNAVNRKVEKKETVTTPAGTFECFVIYSENETKTMMVNKTFPARQWMSEGVGIVRQESYNQKGKLEGYMELTALTK